MSALIEDRAQQLAVSLATVRARIEAACRSVGRRPGDVTLVVVTKYFPAADVARLARLGVRDIGENRDQEASAKVAELVDLAERSAATLPFLPTVHFIGQVQTNKAGSVAGYADVVHSVDRLRLVEALSRGALAHGREVDVLVQVSLGQATTPERGTATTAAARGGADPSLISTLARALEEAPGLRLRGLMAVAPVEVDPDASFARLRNLHERLLAEHPTATWLSAGMSADLESAIAHGATHVRVGSAILGARRP